MSPLETAIRFFPEIALGIALNLCTGLFIDKINVSYLVTISSIVTVVAPLVMALTNPAWGYWLGGFWAALTCPFSGDGIANLSVFLFCCRR